LTIEDVIEELIKEDIDDETDIAFATKEFNQDMKGVRKAVAKFKGLLKKNKDKRRVSRPRSQLHKLVAEVRARAIVSQARRSPAVSRQPSNAQQIHEADGFSSVGVSRTATPFRGGMTGRELVSPISDRITMALVFT